VEAATEAGFEALVLTADLPGPGPRESEPPANLALPEGPALPHLPGRGPGEGFHTGLHAVVDDTLTWRDLEWLRSICPLPLVVKGILTAEDALLAAEHGAAAGGVPTTAGR